MRPPRNAPLYSPGFKQPDQLVGDRRSGDLSHSAATHDRLERFGQIAGRMGHVATVEFLPASDCQEAPELLASAIGLKLTGDVPSDARAWTNSSTTASLKTVITKRI